MGWQSDTAVTIAQVLDDASVGTWVPTAPGVVSTGNIIRGPLPADVCPGIGIQTYRVGADDPSNPTTQIRVQLYLRAADVDALDNLDSAAYDALQGLHGVPTGSAVITDVQSYSSVPMGVDANGNAERTANYTVDLDLPDSALRAY
jgi:hypothetical protein